MQTWFTVRIKKCETHSHRTERTENSARCLSKLQVPSGWGIQVCYTLLFLCNAKICRPQVTCSLYNMTNTRITSTWTHIHTWAARLKGNCVSRGEGESKHEFLLIVVGKEEQVVQQTVTSLQTGVQYLPSIRFNTKENVQKNNS